ncbi:MAG TPA: hypothetical protein VL485_06165, partial [Ktedonobacteraceae bacterium]|nr:hypothetical protein [Ktedonobacteraceae bacterium]
VERQKEERRKRLVNIEKRLVALMEDRDSIGEEILKEKRNLKKANIKTSPILQMWEGKLAKSIEQEQELLAEQKVLQAEHKEVGSLAEELEILEEIWHHKPIGLRRELIEGIIKRIHVKFCSPRVFKVTIEWASSKWGVQEAYLLREKANNHRWSDEEVALLRQLRQLRQPRASSLELWLAFPDRTLSSIRWKLCDLQLPSFDHKVHEANWTYDDVQFLQKLGYDVFSFDRDLSPYNLVGWSISLV